MHDTTHDTSTMTNLTELATSFLVVPSPDSQLLCACLVFCALGATFYPRATASKPGDLWQFPISKGRYFLRFFFFFETRQKTC
jgi:hypothetical protein